MVYRYSVNTLQYNLCKLYTLYTVKTYIVCIKLGFYKDYGLAFFDGLRLKHKITCLALTDTDWTYFRYTQFLGILFTLYILTRRIEEKLIF